MGWLESRRQRKEAKAKARRDALLEAAREVERLKQEQAVARRRDEERRIRASRFYVETPTSVSSDTETLRTVTEKRRYIEGLLADGKISPSAGRKIMDSRGPITVQVRDPVQVNRDPNFLGFGKYQIVPENEDSPPRFIPFTSDEFSKPATKKEPTETNQEGKSVTEVIDKISRLDVPINAVDQAIGNLQSELSSLTVVRDEIKREVQNLELVPYDFEGIVHNYRYGAMDEAYTADPDDEDADLGAPMHQFEVEAGGGLWLFVAATSLEFDALMRTARMRRFTPDAIQGRRIIVRRNPDERRIVPVKFIKRGESTGQKDSQGRTVYYGDRVRSGSGNNGVVIDRSSGSSETTYVAMDSGTEVAYYYTDLTITNENPPPLGKAA